MGGSVNTQIEKQNKNKRLFPRIEAECPVLYRTNAQERWCVGILQDFSATGVLMICNRNLATGTKISLRLERERNKILPALRGSGIITRSNKLSNTKYEIACKLTKIDLPNMTTSEKNDGAL